MTDVDLSGAGVSLRATRHGHTDGGLPLVLLHGLSAQRRFFDPVARRLPGEVIALDQRGHGESDKPVGPYDIEVCADDAAAATHAMGLQRVIAVGHSWGATVAVEWAVRHPEQVAAVVAIDGGAFPPIPEELRAGARERLAPPRLQVDPDRIGSLYADGNDWWTEEATAAVTPGWEIGDDGLARSRIGFERHMAVLDGLLAHDSHAAWDRLTRPAWLVTCEPASASAGEPSWADRREETIRRVASRGPDTRVLRWQGAVHDVPLQWPDLVAGLLQTVRAETSRAEDARGGTEAG
jgi:pimeloyl-ACP methyl ester carboxylesterase